MTPLVNTQNDSTLEYNYGLSSFESLNLQFSQTSKDLSTEKLV